MADKDFTVREIEIMAKAWNCMIEEPKVNYEKLANECGMTNPRSASNAWAAIKKKILAKGGIGKDANGEEGGASTPKPKATPRKRGKKAEGEEDDAEESPTKKAKATPTPKGKKGKAAKSEEEVVEEEGEVKKEDGKEDEEA